MVLLLVFHISLHIEPLSLLVEERKVIKSLFMVHLVVLVLHVCRLQNSWEWMFMGRQVQKLVYRLSKTIIAIRSTTEKKVILTNSRKIRIVFIGHDILAFDWSIRVEQQFENQLKFDLIIEMLANVNLQHDMEMLANKGRIMV